MVVQNGNQIRMETFSKAASDVRNNYPPINDLIDKSGYGALHLQPIIGVRIINFQALYTNWTMKKFVNSQLK